MIFRQKVSLWSSREYIIEKDGLKVIVRALTGTSKEFFDFHHIGKVVIRKKKKSWLSLLLALLLLAYGIWSFTDAFNGGDHIHIAVVCILLALLLFFFISGQKHLYLWNEKNSVSIKFLNNTPSEQDLMIFIAYIKKAQRIRLQQLYMSIDENMSYKEYRDNIQWLWDNDFLSQEEAEQRLGVVGSKFCLRNLVKESVSNGNWQKGKEFQREVNSNVFDLKLQVFSVSLRCSIFNSKIYNCYSSLHGKRAENG